MQHAFRLHAENPNMAHTEIQHLTTVKGVEIPYTTLNDRLGGRRGHGTGYCAGRKRTPCVLNDGKSKQGFIRVAYGYWYRKFYTSNFHLYSSVDQENDLASTIMYFSRCGFPFKTRKIRGLAYELAIRTKRLGFNPTKKIAGKAWLTGFLYRHPELMRKNTKNLSIARAKGANPTQIGYWFQMFKNAMNKLNLWYTPNRIWNIDECGVSDVPREGEAVVGVKGEQYSQAVSGEKPSNSTVLTFVSAGGLAVPPMVIFKGQRVATEWREAAPSGYTIKASENGYINQKHFSDY